VAFTKEIAFLDNLIDYRCEDEEDYGPGADEVRVSGTLKPKEYLEDQDVSDWPIVEISFMERVDIPESKAVVGEKRDPETFDSTRVLHPILQVARFAGRRSQEFTLDAAFQRYSSGEISLEVNDLPIESVEIKFPNTIESMFDDYRDNDPVTITGTFSELEYDTLILEGVSIARKVNIRSEVTSKGRAIPVLDFEENENIWSDADSSYPKPPSKKKILMGGKFVGITQDGKTHYLQLADLFFEKYGGDELNIAIGMSTAAKEFFDSLSVGDEVIFETLLRFRRKRTSHGDYESVIEPQVLWISRIGTPDDKVELRAPRE